MTHTLKRMEDHHLVVLTQQGNDLAFSELSERHRSNCFKLARSIVRNAEDAEDEVQNALWKAYSNISGFQQEAQFSTWLSRIVVNQCLMKLRKNKRAATFSIDDVRVGDDNVTVELPDRRDTPEACLGRDQVDSVLRREVNRIPPLMREVVRLRDLEQRPMLEVAELLGISIAAAKSRLLRARRELRQRLEKHTGHLGPATLMTEA